MTRSERLRLAAVLGMVAFIVGVFLVGLASTPGPDYARTHPVRLPEPAPGPAVPDPGVRPEVIP